MPPIQYDYDKIKNEIFPKLKIGNELKDNFMKTDNLKEFEYKISDEVYLGPKKRNRNKDNKNNEKAKRIGRKRKNDNSVSIHSRDSHDNIVTKIKAKILSYLSIIFHFQKFEIKFQK